MLVPALAFASGSEKRGLKRSEQYGEIITAFQREVWSVVAPILVDREAAKDVVQKTFLNIYTNLDKYRPDSICGWPMQ